MKLVLAPIFILLAVAVARPYGSADYSDLINNIHEFYHTHVISINEELSTTISVKAVANLEIDASGLFNEKIKTQEDFDYSLKETVHVAVKTELDTVFGTNFWKKADHDFGDAITEYCELSASDFRSCAQSSLHDISTSVGKMFHGYMNKVKEHLEVNLHQHISEQIDASFKEKDIDFGFEKISINGKIQFSDNISKSVSIWVDSWESDTGATWSDKLETSVKEHYSESDSESVSSS